MLLGELLLKKKLITTLTLQRYLDQAKEQGKRIGEVLVSNGVITHEQLMDLLEEQGYIRKATPDKVFAVLKPIAD